MPEPAGLCDLHCHLLYGVDDGAKTVEDSLAMARALVELGFTTVAPSPHNRPEYAARETEYHQYPVPVKGVQDIADKAITGNETIYVAQEKLAKYETQLQTPKGQQLRDRAYTEFKAA